MKVTVDPGSGFCFGVELAIKTAEAELDSGKEVYCLGEMVHNQVQMERLRAKGLKIITHDELTGMGGKNVLIRAHGEPPETFRIAEENGVNLINATCPIVTKLQKHIHTSAFSDKSSDIQIVIYGKPGHAEVTGLLGNAGNKALIISTQEDLEKIDFKRPVHLFSQTTMDGEIYILISEAIKERMLAAGNAELVINKSVCKQVSGRAPALRSFAGSHDVIVFVGGQNSANGAYLFGICKEVNSRSFYISNVEDVKEEWFTDCSSVGLSGATSTPGWQIEQVSDFIEQI